jgi:hypothetical protein
VASSPLWLAAEKPCYRPLINFAEKAFQLQRKPPINPAQNIGWPSTKTTFQRYGS